VCVLYNFPCCLSVLLRIRTLIFKDIFGLNSQENIKKNVCLCVCVMCELCV
jgi:hypothetical protein